VQHDFDIVGAGLQTSNDEGGMVALLQNLSSTSPSNRVGIKDPAIDAGLKAIRSAPDDAGRTAGYKAVSEAVNNSLPMLSYEQVDQYMAWAPNVKGIQETMRDSILFDKAWISS
jgi:ABC-type oligopeptide transport system substrate-binding subunit